LIVGIFTVVISLNIIEVTWLYILHFDGHCDDPTTRWSCKSVHTWTFRFKLNVLSSVFTS